MESSNQTYKDTFDSTNNLKEIENTFQTLNYYRQLISHTLTTLANCKSAISEKIYYESNTFIYNTLQELQKFELDLFKYKDTYRTCTSDYNKMLNTIQKHHPSIKKKMDKIYYINKKVQQTFDKQQADAKKEQDANKQAFDILKSSNHTPTGKKPQMTNIDIPIHDER